MTLEELAKETGVDLAVLAPTFISKANEFLTAADAQYKTAKELKEAAETNLRKVQEEQDAINAQIAAFGSSEQTTLALQANYAAMEAQLKSLKEQGIQVNIPEPLKAAPTTQQPAFDPQKFRNDSNLALLRGLDITNEFQRIFNKPLPVSLESLAQEAAAARQPFNRDFVAKKYDFAGEQKRQADEAAKKHDEEIAAAAVKKFQEEHPRTDANPMLRGGVESQASKIIKPRDAKDQRSYAGMPELNRIANSVARTRAAIAANQS